MDYWKVSTHTFQKNNETTIYLYLSFMTATWSFFIPMAILLARHKWMFGNKEFLGIQKWYRVYTFMQLIGSGLFTAYFVIMLIFMDFPNFKKSNVSYWLNVGIASSIGFLILMNIVRPNTRTTDNNPRYYWNLLHKFIGYITMFTGIGNMYLSFNVFHISYNLSYIPWIVSSSTSLFVILWLQILLEVANQKRLLFFVQDPENQQN